MACLLPIVPHDVKCCIAEMKYKLETKSYKAFFEDFIVDVIGYKETRNEDEVEDFLFQVISDTYNLKVTYKPTGLHFMMPFVLSRCSSTSAFENHTIKKLSIKHIHRTTRNFKIGEWKHTTDACGTWYYSNKLNLGVVFDETYKEWEKLTEELQQVMMNRFDRFIEVE